MKKVYNPTVEHLNHPVKFIKGKYGPHNGKIICELCNKFVKWASKSEMKQLINK